MEKNLQKFAITRIKIYKQIYGENWKIIRFVKLCDLSDGTGNVWFVRQLLAGIHSKSEFHPNGVGNKFELSANLSKNATKWPKMTPKWPKVAQI